MTDISGRTALITGGASGIGLLMGEILLKKGLDRLIVWDVSDENIAAVVGWSDSLRLEMEAEDTGVRVTTVIPYYIDTTLLRKSADGRHSPFPKRIHPMACVTGIPSAV